MLTFETGRPEALAGACQGLYVKSTALLPAVTFCSGGPEVIDISRTSSKNVDCDGTPHGLTKLVWRTVGTSDSGFGDGQPSPCRALG